MSKKPETLFKEKVFEDLKTISNCWFEKIQQVTIRGTPDVLCCVNGKFVALELKKDLKETPDPLQKYKLNKISKAGGHSYTTCPEDWASVLKELRSI